MKITRKQEYRIVENQFGFFIQEKVIEEKYIGIWPFRSINVFERWISLKEKGSIPRIVDLPKRYDTIEEAKEVISNIEKYPIYHYLEK